MTGIVLVEGCRGEESKAPAFKKHNLELGGLCCNGDVVEQNFPETPSPDFAACGSLCYPKRGLAYFLPEGPDNKCVGL